MVSAVDSVVRYSIHVGCVVNLVDNANRFASFDFGSESMAKLADQLHFLFILNYGVHTVVARAVRCAGRNVLRWRVGLGAYSTHTM